MKNNNPDMEEKETVLKSTRDEFGEAIIQAGEENDDIVVLTADLAESTRVDGFKNRFPNRFFEVGVAEQVLVTVASGMANYGKIPFATSFAVFSPGRNWEQIRTTICLNNVPVKIVGSHTGLSVGEDGATHQALEDIALMRVLPNIEVVVPCDALEASKATLAISKTKKPSYLRLTRSKTPLITRNEDSFELGKISILRKSDDPMVSIIGTGPILNEALLAADELEKTGISVNVVNLHTIKPIDELGILNQARISGAIVTLEEHQIYGGVGSAIAELVGRGHPVPIEMVGVNDQFGESGTKEELWQKFELTSEFIIRKVKNAILRKNS